MKKAAVLILIVWGLASFFFYTIIINTDQQDENYLVKINRIQNRIESENLVELQAENSSLNQADRSGALNTEAAEILSLDLSNFSSEELGAVTEIQVLALEGLNQELGNEFFISSGSGNYRQLFQLSESGKYIFKYRLKRAADSYSKFIYLFLFISAASIIVFIIYYRIEREIFRPLKKAAGLPEKMALGQFESLKLQTENKYLRKLFWGLDMLQEKLKREEEKNHQLERDQKTMVAGLSHDIRTPLSTIKNYAIALNEGVYSEKEDIERALEIIISRTDDIEKLSRKLIKTSAKDIELNSTDYYSSELYLDDLHSRLLEILNEKTERLPLKLKLENAPENLLLKADLNLLTQVLNNVVENALKYGDLKELSLKYRCEDYYQLLELENSGSHIPAKELKHIFNSYYRGSNVKSESGFGLGLFISKKIMTALEGDIYAENTEKGVKIVLVIKIA